MILVGSYFGFAPCGESEAQLAEFPSYDCVTFSKHGCCS
jgi:hypothetical protein